MTEEQAQDRVLAERKLSWIDELSGSAAFAKLTEAMRERRDELQEKINDTGTPDADTRDMKQRMAELGEWLMYVPSEKKRLLAKING